MLSSLSILLLAIPMQATGFTILAQNSLFVDSGYNWTGAFETYAGLPAGTIQLLQADTAELINATLSFRPDIVIGIDNNFAVQIPAGTFQFYNSSQLVNIPTNIWSRLLLSYNLSSYDFSPITTNFWRPKLATIPSQMTLSSLVNQPSLLANLVVPNPTLSSPGVAFLLSTIATFGDAASGIPALPGVNSGGWQAWWATTLRYATIASDWTESYYQFFSNMSTSLSIMAGSYGTSPAYDICLYNDTDEQASAPSGQAWLIIEGVGITSWTTNLTLSQQFVDWFLSLSNQANIWEKNWVQPANTLATVPLCYTSSLDVLYPNVTDLNQYIPVATLRSNFARWQNEWNVIYTNATAARNAATTSVPSGTTGSPSATTVSPFATTRATSSPSPRPSSAANISIGCLWAALALVCFVFQFFVAL